MLTLAAGNTIQGVAGTASAITYTINGCEIAGGVDTYKILAQGQLPDSVAAIYTVSGSTTALVKNIILTNTTVSGVENVILYVNGTDASNQIHSAITIENNGSLIFDQTGWKAYDSSGILIGTIMQGPVTTIFGRTGDVVAVPNDYTWAQIDKAVSDIANINNRSHTSLTDIGTNTHSQIDIDLTRLVTTSGSNSGDQIVPVNTVSGSNLFFNAYDASSGIISTARPAWENIDKTISSIADITTKSHTSLTDVGTNTHTTIDSHITALASGTYNVQFNYTGVLNTGTDIDIGYCIPFDSTITHVTMYRKTAGSDGSTIVDLNAGASGVAGTTLYSTQANRPTITQADGSYKAITATLPDIVTISGGYHISMDIDAIESGTPRDLSVGVWLRRLS